jgi:hypothetical protein
MEAVGMDRNEAEELIREIRLFIDYGVEDGVSTAKELVDRYRNSPLVLRLFHAHYATLPEAREEAVCRVCKINSRQGIHLFVAATQGHAYLYALSSDQALYLGEYKKEVDSQTMLELLQFFGYQTQQAFLGQCPAVDRLEEYQGEEEEGTAVCPVCQVVEGEQHLLGCVVEICPWCDAQLSSCNCRFEQLGIDAIENEEQLERFAELLEEKGRIPFRRTESPAYPGTSKGLDKK